jgi:hypothetical protein
MFYLFEGIVLKAAVIVFFVDSSAYNFVVTASWFLYI